MVTDLDVLNVQFALPEQLRFAAGLGDLPTVQVTNDHATATIVLQGGHVLAFQPRDTDPVLFVSQESHYTPGKSIRGGIPICWPWFGPHPTDSTQPQHGFVRVAPWSVRGTSATADGATQLRLGLTDSEATLAHWPHPFDLELEITVGHTLTVELIARNTGSETFTCTGALHSYFNVGDVTAIAVEGLDGLAYIDKLDQGQRHVQHGPVTISAETDRIYLDTPPRCTIIDPQLQRRIHLSSAGSRSTVVWNPWIEKAQSMADFADDEYPGMVCVETANAGDDVITVAPGGEHRLRVTIEVERDASA